MRTCEPPRSHYGTYSNRTQGGLSTLLPISGPKATGERTPPIVNCSAIPRKACIPLEQGVADRIDDDTYDEDGGHDDHHPHTPYSAAAAGSPSPAAQRRHRPAGAAAAVSPRDGRDARDLREARRVLVAKRLHRRFERGGVPAGGKRSGCPDESGVASSRRFDLIATVLAEPCPHMRGVADVVAIVRRRTAGWGRRRHGEPARARGPQARNTCDAAS